MLIGFGGELMSVVTGCHLRLIGEHVPVVGGMAALHWLFVIPVGGETGASGATSTPAGRAGWVLVPTRPGVPALGALTESAALPERLYVPEAAHHSTVSIL